MKGNQKLVKALDGLLADELTAINQYMVHSEMCDNWGYERLHKIVEQRAIVEMRHAETLIGRILFLEGVPTVSKLNQINIGADVPKQFQHDLAAEMQAVRTTTRLSTWPTRSATRPPATCWWKFSGRRTDTSIGSKSKTI